MYIHSWESKRSEWTERNVRKNNEEKWSNLLNKNESIQSFRTWVKFGWKNYFLKIHFDRILGRTCVKVLNLWFIAFFHRKLRLNSMLTILFCRLKNSFCKLLLITLLFYLRLLLHSLWILHSTDIHILHFNESTHCLTWEMFVPTIIPFIYLRLIAFVPQIKEKKNIVK